MKRVQNKEQKEKGEGGKKGSERRKKEENDTVQWNKITGESDTGVCRWALLR